MLERLPETLGQALRDQRAGLEKIAFNRIKLPAEEIDLTSIAFNDHAPIPRRYTADGEGISPPLQWTGVPPDALSLVLMVEDADAPTPQPLVHAIAVGLSPRDGALEAGALPNADQSSVGLRMGRNSYMQARWIPPDPPPGHGAHRYAFQVFALRAAARFSDTPGRDEVEEQLRRFGICSGCLIATYERTRRTP